MSGRIPVELRDVALLAAHALLLPVAWLAPEAHWLAWGRALARAAPPTTTQRILGRAAARAVRAHPRLGDPQRLVLEVRARGVEQTLQYLREWRPRGWRPSWELVGRDHLQEALGRGRGAVLWVGHLAGAALLVKKALWQEDFRLCHLSVPFHGLSDTRFGRRVLNTIRIRPERRHLGERIVMELGDELRALRVLERRLRDNGLVSISCVPLGRRLTEVPFLGGRIALPTGAPGLALATGARLLPVFVRRRGAGAFVVVVEAPLSPAPGARGRDAVDALVAAYAERLEACVLADPPAWRSWTELEVRA